MELNLSPEFLVASGQVDSSWLPALAECRQQLANLAVFLDTERAAGVQVLPPPEKIFRALKMPVERVKVLIVGQDPYPTPGHAVGLAFSTPPDVMPLPRSLSNIFSELHSDMGCTKPKNGDLSAWEDQGVLLLNRVLSVRAKNPGSHKNKGWEFVTTALIRFLESNNPAIVAILWGKNAQELDSLFPENHVIFSSHPSPLSAAKGFFGSKPFSKCNSILGTEHMTPVDWDR
jgi:uracil-DNA glycosylase